MSEKNSELKKNETNTKVDNSDVNNEAILSSLSNNSDVNKYAILSTQSKDQEVTQKNLPPMIGSKRYKYQPQQSVFDNLEKVYQDDAYAYPFGLNFFMQCSLCGDHGETSGFEFAGYNNGWNFCEKCRIYGILGWTVKRYLTEEKLIPVDWFLYQKKQQPRVIKFLHKSAENENKVKEMTLKYDLEYIFRISKTTGLIYIKLVFDDLYHPVSLANLFTHNSGLYEELIHCQNFFDNEYKLVFGYDDLSDTLKTEIMKMHNISEAYKRGETTFPF